MKKTEKRPLTNSQALTILYTEDERRALKTSARTLKKPLTKQSKSAILKEVGLETPHNTKKADTMNNEINNTNEISYETILEVVKNYFRSEDYVWLVCDGAKDGWVRATVDEIAEELEIWVGDTEADLDRLKKQLSTYRELDLDGLYRQVDREEITEKDVHNGSVMNIDGKFWVVAGVYYVREYPEETYMIYDEDHIVKISYETILEVVKEKFGTETFYMSCDSAEEGFIETDYKEVAKDIFEGYIFYTLEELEEEISFKKEYILNSSDTKIFKNVKELLIEKCKDIPENTSIEWFDGESSGGFNDKNHLISKYFRMFVSLYCNDIDYKISRNVVTPYNYLHYTVLRYRSFVYDGKEFEFPKEVV